MIRTQMSAFKKGWDYFWFSEKDLRPLALMRIILAGSLFYSYLIRGLFNISYYSENSLVPREKALELYPEFYKPLFSWYFWSDSYAPVLHWLLVGLLFFLTLGILNRFGILVLWVLHMAFMQRNYAVAYGADMVAQILFLYLAGTKCCEVWSIKSRVFKKVSAVVSMDLFNSVCYRLIQVHIAIIYTYTGIEKLKGSSWWDGTALWSVLANPMLVMFDLSFLRYTPSIIGLLTISTLIFEIYWVAAMTTKARKYWLMVGVIFHVTIAALMNMWVFSLVMMSTYILYIDGSTLERLRLRFVSYFNR